MTHSDPSLPEQPPVLRPQLPDWGVYLRPPEDGVQWIHADDRELALQLIPSPRIFCRRRWDGDYYWLHYGPQTIRVRPSMWLLLPPLDVEIGAQVELLARHGLNDAGIYRIAELMFNAASHQVEYYLRRDELVLSRPFEREDLQVLHPHFKLRVGFYRHEPPKAALPNDLELLDVGDLLNEERKA